MTVLGGATAGAGQTPLSIAVSGNHFVNGNGETVQLVGVDRTSPEYACFYGYAYSNGPIDASDAAAIAAWHANAVRIPLNEDCWLGINGSPESPLTVQGYRQAIEAYVRDLNADGIYAILDLHWSAPGSVPANGQRPLPDEHSPAFWESVASAFKSDPAVLFDAFNEPFSPAANGNTNYPVSWSCWKNGGCEIPDANDEEPVNGAQTYHAVGLQAIVDAIRSTGASQPILLGGLSYANELNEWLTYEPTDPDHQLAASFHNYEGENCGTESCWSSTIAPLAEHVPIVTGEFGEDDCPAGGGDDPSDFDNRYMNWADQHGVSYLAWAWVELEKTEPCGTLFMLTATGEPAQPNGVAVHDHLAALALARTAEPIDAPAGESKVPTGESKAPAGTPTVRPESSPQGSGVKSIAAISREPVIAALIAALTHKPIPTRSALLSSAGWQLHFTAPAPGRLSIELTDSAKKRHPVILAAATQTFIQTNSTTVRLHLNHTGRRLLRSGSSLRLTLSLTFAAQGLPAAQEHTTVKIPRLSGTGHR
jgi:endoglucanase